MPSDFKHIQKSGSECVGCGRGSNEGVMLMRLRTYSRALCCGACFMKPEYSKCHNENILGVKCGHDPQDHYHFRGPCSMAGCGCQNWHHGLERDHDRMYADAVGKAPQSQKCHGFAGRQCDNIVFVSKNGQFEPLCSHCKREYVQGYEETRRDAAKILEIDESKDTIH